MLLDVGGHIFHFQNDSSTVLLFATGSGVAGYNGATINGAASYSLAAGARATVGIVAGTRNMRVSTSTIELPNSVGVTADAYRAGSGLLLMNTNQQIKLNATTTTGFVIPASSVFERAFYLRNISTTSATLTAGTGVTITGSLTVAVGRTAYVRNTGDTTWLVTTPIIHLPAPSATDDPLPNGANVDITEAGTEVRVYADVRTIGYWWLINNSSGTDVLINPKISGTGVAAPSVGDNRVVPAGTTALVRQIQTGRFVLLVECAYRSVQIVTTNYTTIDGAYENKLAVLKMQTPDANGLYGLILNTSQNLADGAIIEILNHCSLSVTVTSPSVGILSRLDKKIIPSGSSVIVRYIVGMGFLLMGDLV